jgi:hypothetical protein
MEQADSLGEYDDAMAMFSDIDDSSRKVEDEEEDAAAESRPSDAHGSDLHH